MCYIYIRSTYSAACKGQEPASKSINCVKLRGSMQVDCAYYSESLAETSFDPVEAMRAEISAAGDSNLSGSCDACDDNMRAMWCNQIAPPCGSFAAQVCQNLYAKDCRFR